MITFIILGVVAVLAIAFVLLAWNNGARKRKDQSEIPSERTTRSQPEVGRAVGPD